MDSHILVVDDDNRIKELLKKYLSNSGFIVSSASCVKQAKELMEKYIFDILVIDNMMPDETGMEFLQKLRQAENFVPVIMLTALGEIEDKIEGLSAGADDYVCKPFEPKELILRINNILKRTQIKNENDKLFYFDKYSFDFEKNELSKDSQELIKLTDMDLKLLKLFIKNVNKVLSREKVCRLTNNTNERTLDVQITRLRKKIEEDVKKPRMLKTIRNKGYIFNV
ncbi:MAG: response regulator [Rickettsiales bacterium]|jgi:two-component system phosphate regulon response regulator OmpR|nr:response regulator [Rickettsiales bacterium]